MANGTQDYTLGHFAADIETLKKNQAEIKKQVRDLNVWRWKTVGAVSTISAIISLGVSFLT